MNNNYLIPANSKKSQLILGFFTGVDLIILGIGCAITLSLLIIFGQSLSTWQSVIVLIPAVISGFLVTPVLHYHNVLQFITNVVKFLFNPRRYYWRGWCAKDERE